MFAILGALGAVIKGLAEGIVGPVFGYLGKKQDVTLDGFRQASGLDEKAFEAWLQYQMAHESSQAAARSWWGPKLLCMIVGVPACLHVAMVFLDSTFRLGCNHYGCLGIPDVPARWVTTENTVIGFVFGVSVVGPMASMTAAWLRRR